MAQDPAKNFAEGTLNAGITNLSTSLVLQSGQGANFPTLSGSQQFNAVVWDSTLYTNPNDDPNKEIVTVTAINVDTFTITRGQESTLAANHNTSTSTYKLTLSMTTKTLGYLAAGFGDYIDDTGAANTITLTIPNYPSTLSRGMQISFKLNNSITGAATVNINSGGANPLVKPGGSGTTFAMVNGDILVGAIVQAQYDGTNWVITAPTFDLIFSVAYQLANNTSGGTATANAWTIYPLNTILQNDISVGALSSNKFTLPAGTYELIDSYAYLGGGGTNHLRLRNITDSANTLIGGTGYSGTGAGQGTIIHLPPGLKFTITASKQFEIDYFTTAATGASDLGVLANATDALVNNVGVFCFKKVA